MTETKLPPVFGKDTMDSVKPAAPISKEEAERIRRHATHPSGIDTTRPIPRIPEDQRPHIKFPEPRVRKAEDGRRFTILGAGSHVYSGPHSEEERILIGDLVYDIEGEYLKRIPHPNPEMMPSILIGYENPVRIQTPEGEIMDFTGKGFSDRRGEDWDGMIEPSTRRKMREKREQR